MVAGIFHVGSGLGNQLFRYVATRVLALDNGYEFGMLAPENFKGKAFMDIDTGGYAGSWELGEGGEVLTANSSWPKRFKEKKIVENGVDIRGYDPEINFVKDYTLIDGEFQDIKYFGHRLPEIAVWLRTEKLEIPDNVCVIGFRGGEYVGIKDLFLSKSYWFEAIGRMLNINQNMKFEVHTDDPETARQFFPDYPIIKDIGVNWRSMRYAKHAIIANSSFYILPRLLSGGVTIAPRYWARRNTGVWALPQNFYKEFTYL